MPRNQYINHIVSDRDVVMTARLAHYSFISMVIKDRYKR